MQTMAMHKYNKKLKRFTNTGRKKQTCCWFLNHVTVLSRICYFEHIDWMSLEDIVLHEVTQASGPTYMWHLNEKSRSRAKWLQRCPLKCETQKQGYLVTEYPSKM